MHRHSFLERKGLTKEEIDEAFRRVPDPTPTVSTTQPVAAIEDEKVKSSSTTQPLSASQNLQPASALQSYTMRKMGYFSHFHWTHAVMAVSILAASGAGTALLLKQSYSNRELDVDARSVRSLSPPASVEPSVPPHPKSYMDIMAMIQRGEKPSNIQDVNDQPPNPNQPMPDSHVGPKPKPWEIGQSLNSSRNFLQSQGSGDGLNYEYKDNLTNGDSSTPWWQRKNARITEIEGENEQKFGSTAAPTEV